MPGLGPGLKAPDFSLPDQSGKKRSLKEFKGRWVLLYFYPKDDTPGCTTEACALRDQHQAIKRAGAQVIGISVDDVKSHDRFAKKYELPFLLLADEDKEVVRSYGVWGKKKFMGREYDGTHRVSFLIDPKGKIAKIYELVRPADHAEEVLGDVAALARE